MAKSTTIKISRETKERLKKRGMKGDTYEDVILELLEIAETAEDDLSQVNQS